MFPPAAGFLSGLALELSLLATKAEISPINEKNKKRIPAKIPIFPASSRINPKIQIPNPANKMAIPQLVPRFLYPPSPRIKQGMTAQIPPHPSPMKIGGIMNQKLPFKSSERIANTPIEPINTRDAHTMLNL